MCVSTLACLPGWSGSVARHLYSVARYTLRSLSWPPLLHPLPRSSSSSSSFSYLDQTQLLLRLLRLSLQAPLAQVVA